MPGLSNSGPRIRNAAARPGRDIMHPMFVKLFIQTDADDLLPEQDRRRRARRSRRPGRPWPRGPRPVTGSTGCGRDRRPAGRRPAGSPMRRNPLVPDGNRPASAPATEPLVAVTGPRPAPEGAQP